MDKLNALTAGQKALIALFVLGIVAAGFWQLVIVDAEDKAVASRAKAQKLQTEYGQLREYEKKSRLDEVQAAMAAIEARLEENKRLLPPEDELPSFIMSIKADADAAGLEVLRFEPQAAEVEDYYRMIPVKVEVLGKASDLIDFFQTLASPKKLIVNLREIEVRRLPLDVLKIQQATGDALSHFDKAAKFKRLKKEEKDMTNEERRMLKLQRWQLANEMNRVEASFVAYTFVYTGEPMPEDLRKKKKRTQRRRG